MTVRNVYTNLGQACRPDCRRSLELAALLLRTNARIITRPLSLTPGTLLGPYEIIAALGAGGMGEVYRARDTRLNRDVAIKVLPRAVAHDSERRERFEREAQTIAALNHPNIVTIHAIEQTGETAFLAMELVEGRPLSELIPRGGLRLDQLLKTAIPVVDAVVAAHQKGITHRDLKPANIMIGSREHEGRVKVLDFGLAKLSSTSPGGDATTALATGEGRILGTVAYMSPEQAEGKSIDARSDLFSLGVILYEMATGARPFTGGTSISIISSIVKGTPVPLSEVNPATPRDLARIVRRALAKDPEKRYQTAKTGMTPASSATRPVRWSISPAPRSCSRSMTARPSDRCSPPRPTMAWSRSTGLARSRGMFRSATCTGSVPRPTMSG